MSFTTLLEKVKSEKAVTIAVVNPVKDEIYKALKEATDRGICKLLLVGNGKIIEQQKKKYGIHSFESVEAPTDREAVLSAIHAIRGGKASCLMKGHISTSTLMKEVLNSEYGLKRDGLLSHIAIVEKPDGSFLGITDGGLNINPSLKDKVEIVKNAIFLFHKLGVEKPKVAILSAVEMVNPAIPSTIEASVLDLMGKRGQIKGAIVEGPLALDLAVSEKACDLKDVHAKITGNADILVVPDIVSGNVLGKALIYLAQFPSGGIVIGATVPIILLSRSDSSRDKFNSILLGVIASHSF